MNNGSSPPHTFTSNTPYGTLTMASIGTTESSSRHHYPPETARVSSMTVISLSIVNLRLLFDALWNAHLVYFVRTHGLSLYLQMSARISSNRAAASLMESSLSLGLAVLTNSCAYSEDQIPLEVSSSDATFFSRRTTRSFTA